MEAVIREYKQDDLRHVASMISATFRENNFYDNELQAATSYYQFFDPSINSEDEITKVFSDADVFFVAEIDGKIVGAIRGSFNQISSLFVSTKSHRNGIGRKLIEAFERKSNEKMINVNSQIYSVKFYEAMGFKICGSEKKSHGLKIIPMEKHYSAP